MTPKLQVSDVEVGLAKLLVEMNSIDGLETEPLIVEISHAVPTDKLASQRQSIEELERQVAQVGAATADNAQKVVSLDTKVREIEASKASPRTAKQTERLGAKKRALRALQRRGNPLSSTGG